MVSPSLGTPLDQPTRFVIGVWIGSHLGAERSFDSVITYIKNRENSGMKLKEVVVYEAVEPDARSSITRGTIRNTIRLEFPPEEEGDSHVAIREKWYPYFKLNPKSFDFDAYPGNFGSRGRVHVPIARETITAAAVATAATIAALETNEQD